MDRMEADEDAPAELRKSLNGVQIFFIVISSVIGTGIFSGNGDALAASGPVGLLLDVLALGCIAVCVGETVSEFVQLWGVPNAVYEYVAAFVDEDVAWAVAILYWYSFASAAAVQMLSAAKLMLYWQPENWLPPLIFFGLVPWALFILNMAGVQIYAWTETFLGALKAVLLFGVTCVLFDISAKGDLGNKSLMLDGLQYDPSKYMNQAHAFFYGIPSVAYGFVGIETSVIAAFESRSSRSMAIPSRLVHWYTFVFYLLCTLGHALTVKWTDVHLTGALDDLVNPKSNSPTIIAIFNSPRLGSTSLPGFVNGCLIMSVVSAAATSLYISSRTLYGLVYSLQGSNWVSRRLKTLGTIWRSTHVPSKALLATVLLFYWLPWLYLIPHNKITVEDVLDMLDTTSSASCVITWAFLCLAFIRYQKWTHKCRNALADSKNGDLRRYIRGTQAYEKCPDRHVWNVGMSFQPGLAWVGFLGCILVAVSASAPWWSTPATPVEVVSAYGPHMVGCSLWVIMKVYRWGFGVGKMEWYVPLEGGANPVRLFEKLERLEFLSAYGSRGGQIRGDSGQQEEVDGERSMELGVVSR